MLAVKSVMPREIRAKRQVIYKEHYYFYVMERLRDGSCIVGYKERLDVESVILLSQHVQRDQSHEAGDLQELSLFLQNGKVYKHQLYSR